MGQNFSRRDFLKTTLAGAVGAASASLLGPFWAEAQDAQATQSSTAAPEGIQVTGFAPDGTDCTYGAWLNPQDPAAASAEKPLTMLFSPLKIGGVTLKNRIVKSAAGSEMQDNSEWPSDAALAYYGQFCKGGVGMVCYEASSAIPMPVSGGSAPIPGMSAGAAPLSVQSLDISSDAGIPAHKELADFFHKLDTPVIAQMLDMMTANGSSSTTVDVFDMENSFSSGKMQTTQEVQWEVQRFIEAGERYWKAGFDGIELNASCNHYFSTYLSRFANHERTDQYSGETLENRARILTEIISGIRARVGNDFIIQVLYSGVEENVAKLGQNPYCTSLEEACEFARLFEQAGASSLHIRSEAYGHHCGGFMPDVFHIPEHGHTGYGTVLDYGKNFRGVQGQYDGSGALIEVAAKIKSCVSIPVGAVGSMDPRLNPDLIEQALEDGKLDFILMTRPLMADPQYCNKLQANHRSEIAPCTHCMTCFVAPYDFGTPMYCRVNASLTRAFTSDMPEGYDPLPAQEIKNVLVIGGGPAGMEAARISAQRGHRVTLCEKEPALGASMAVLAAIKGPHEKIQAHTNYLVDQLASQGVTVRTGCDIDAETVRSMNPDAVVVAVGGIPGRLDVPGFDSDKVVLATALAGAVEGESFVVLGGRFQGCEAAINLAQRGKTVTVIHDGSYDEIYQGGATWPLMMGKSWLQAKGVKFMNHAVVQSIDSDGVTFVSEAGQIVTLPADRIINALPWQKNRALYESIAEFCDCVYAVGDCYSPSTIANAIARANLVARHLETQNGAASALTGDQVFTATATGIGDVTVSIQVADGAIANAMVDTSHETQGIGQGLGEAMAQQILQKGDIDAVTGATITCDAVRKALGDCLAQAGLR